MPVAESVFKELFEKEYNNLCRYALTYLQDSQWAEDVVQETFVKFWEQKKELISSPEAKFYLVTAVRNNSLTAIRRQKSAGIQFVEETPETDHEPFITMRQVREEANEQSKKITEALNTLPPKCKEVFLLVKLHGMSYKQAAEALEISVKTVENQMGKAIKTLRDYARSVMTVFLMMLLTKNIFWE